MNWLSTAWGRHKLALQLLILILGAAWIWVSRVPADRTDLLTAPTKGLRAPDFTLADQDGTAVRLSDLRGKPVLINFWASWCPPCRAEMQAMEKAYQQYQAQGFMILAINSTIQDDRSDADEFVREQGLTFSILWDEDGSVTEAYQVRSLPTSFFVDKAGVIREVIIGGPMAEALLVARIEHILQASASQLP